VSLYGGRSLRQARQIALISLTLLLLVAAPFAGGYVLGHADGIGPGETPLESALARVGLGGTRAERPPVPAPSAELNDAFQPFWETWGYVDRDFYNEHAVESHKLSRGAIRGMLASLEDPHTLYLDPTHRQITDADLRGAFDGIGVQVEMEDDQLKIISPLEGSPGQRAGLRPGDIITRVDGNDVHGMSLLDAIQMIRGPRGSSVHLTVARGAAAAFELAVPREEIRVPAVRGEVRPDGVAYIRITSFSLRVGADLRDVLDQLSTKDPHGWVLDLRGNPGGYLDGAVAVASQFVEDKTVLYEERRTSEREEIHTRGRPRALTGPMAVMVDGGTASAAEIVAAALRDHGRATLIGEQTYGKGTVQIVHTLTDGGALRLTVARWLTPTGDPIQGVGLSPTIQVLADTSADSFLEQAVDFVRAQPGSAQRIEPALRQAGRGAPSALVPRRTSMEDEPDKSEAEASVLDSMEQVELGGPRLL